MLTVFPVESGGLGNEIKRFMKRYCVCLPRNPIRPFGKFPPNGLSRHPRPYPVENLIPLSF